MACCFVLVCDRKERCWCIGYRAKGSRERCLKLLLQCFVHLSHKLETVQCFWSSVKKAGGICALLLISDKMFCFSVTQTIFWFHSNQTLMCLGFGFNNFEIYMKSVKHEKPYLPIPGNPPIVQSSQNWERIPSCWCGLGIEGFRKRNSLVMYSAFEIHWRDVWLNDFSFLP